ncbi:MAG: type II toxin-antitoxin system RatA family toxin [Pseudomonadota bacterium]
MPHFETTRRVRHSASDMFDLVADVEKYPQFVPLCDRLVIRDRVTVGDHPAVIADMTVAYKFLRETFTSRAVLDRDTHTIIAEYLDGPFSRMNNKWTFVPRGNEACDVSFAIDYAFRSRTFEMLAGAVFDRAFRKFAAAFEARADAIYGSKAGAAGTAA